MFNNLLFFRLQPLNKSLRKHPLFIYKYNQDYILFGLQFFYLCLKSRDNLLPIADNTKARFFENVCFRVSVNGDDILRSGTTGQVLTGTREGHRNIYIRRNNLAG